MTLSIIPDDGYTESAYVAAMPGVFNAQTIRYRPLTHTERYVIGNALGTKSPAEASKLLIATLAKHLKEWDVCVADGGTLPINAESVAKLKPELAERFYAIVTGRFGGDQNPNEASSGSAADDELKAIMEDRTVGEVREEAHVKN